jgi:hypothetical protein
MKLFYMMLVALVKSNDAGGCQCCHLRVLFSGPDARGLVSIFSLRLRTPPRILERITLVVPPQIPSSRFTNAHSKHSVLYGHSPHSFRIAAVFCD